MKFRTLLVEIAKGLYHMRLGVLQFVQKEKTPPILQRNIKPRLQQFADHPRVLRGEEFAEGVIRLEIQLEIVFKTFGQFANKEGLADLPSATQDQRVAMRPRTPFFDFLRYLPNHEQYYTTTWRFFGVVL